MVSIKWCVKQNAGIQMIQPNVNVSRSYLKMAEESITVLADVGRSKIWTATTAYYVFYYSLYSLMLLMGVKCEIHSCSLEFMKRFLKDFYNDKDMGMIEKAFKARIDLQYYADRAVDDVIIDDIKKYCKDFYIKTKHILSRITESQINMVRKHLEGGIY